MVSFPLINAWIYNIFSHSNLCGCRNQGNIYYATLIIRVPRGLILKARLSRIIQIKIVSNSIMEIWNIRFSKVFFKYHEQDIPPNCV